MADHTRGREARNATVTRRAQRAMKYTQSARINQSGRNRKEVK